MESKQNHGYFRKGVQFTFSLELIHCSLKLIGFKKYLFERRSNTEQEREIIFIH